MFQESGARDGDEAATLSEKKAWQSPSLSTSELA
jgi:hypothetical protein